MIFELTSEKGKTEFVCDDESMSKFVDLGNQLLKMRSTTEKSDEVATSDAE